MDITQLWVPARINVAKYNAGQYLGVGLRTFARLRRVPGNKDEFASANAESRKTLSSSTSKLITSSEKTWIIVDWHQHLIKKIRSFEKHAELSSLEDANPPGWSFAKELPLPYVAHRLTWKWGVPNCPHRVLWVWYKIWITLGQMWDNFGTTVRQLWDNFGTTVRQLWDNCETTLGQLWDNFWTTFGQLWDNSETTLTQQWDIFETSLGHL